MTSTNAHWRERLEAIMPFGSSTCSKRATRFPEEPSVIVRGKGCRVWDADGKEYIDFRNSLGPVSLGYCFPEVDDAIRKQLESGIIFGHPHPLEAEVAEMLCDAVPCAEQARFLKTGGEAISACIKIARHATGRDHVIQIGYNGWLNSLAAGGRVLPGETAPQAPAGVPQALAALHHTSPWNDPQALEELLDALSGQVAAVTVASAYHSKTDGQAFYPALRELTTKHGAVLIFDEIVTGFRLRTAGVQEYFGVTPDLAVFAKGMANGMPVSVYLGCRDLMASLEKAIVSSTYGGETLSLAAARATMDVYRTQGVIEHLWSQGRRLGEGLNGLFRTHGIPVQMQGYDPGLQFAVTPGAPPALLDQLFRAAYKNGISTYNVAYINFSHSGSDIDECLERWERACTTVGRQS